MTVTIDIDRDREGAAWLWSEREPGGQEARRPARPARAPEHQG